jgi:hypothetical protein
MEIISKKIDDKILSILQNKYKHLQLPLGSLYELQQFIISLEGSYQLDSLSRIVLNEDGILYDGDPFAHHRSLLRYLSKADEHGNNIKEYYISILNCYIIIILPYHTLQIKCNHIARRNSCLSATTTLTRRSRYSALHCRPW